MDLFGVSRIEPLEAGIAQIRASIADIERRARSILARGQQGASSLDAFFDARLQGHARRLQREVSRLPEPLAAAWDDPAWKRWAFATGAEEPLLRVGALTRPGSQEGISVPVFVPFIGQGRTTIVRSSDDASKEVAQGLLQALILRIAASFPHQSHFTLLDPATAGLVFPIRRFRAHVRENAGDVRRDLDVVITENQRIIEAHLDATTRSFEQLPRDTRSSERFRFIFANDFPNGYDRRAIDALQQIANTGLPAGAYLFLHHNVKVGLPRDVTIDDFKNAYVLDVSATSSIQGLQVQFDGAPNAETQQCLFEGIRSVPPPDHAIDYDQTVALPQSEWWTHSTADRIETSIGLRSGGGPLNLWFGSNGQHHCVHGMLGAMTGAGKSTLYHVLITGLAMRYSPAELRLFLIDGKNGVEFQPYRHLPHVEVVSLRRPAELARSVLDERRALPYFRRRLALQMGEDFSHRLVRSRRAALPQVDGPTPICALYFDLESARAVRFKPYSVQPEFGQAVRGVVRDGSHACPSGKALTPQPPLPVRGRGGDAPVSPSAHREGETPDRLRSASHATHVEHLQVPIVILSLRRISPADRQLPRSLARQRVRSFISLASSLPSG